MLPALAGMTPSSVRRVAEPDAGRHEQTRGKYGAGRHHHGREKLLAPEHPLSRDRSQTECAPHEEVAGNERRRC